MGSTFHQRGETLPLTLPYDRASGEAFQVGNFFAVAATTGTTGDEVEGHVEGTFWVNTLTTDTPAQGAILYWDDANKRLTTTASTHLAVAIAARAKASGAALTLAKFVPKTA